MEARFGRAMAVVAGLWAGVLLAIALIGAPAAFAVLAERAEAGRVAGHMFAREAYLSLLLAVVLFILERGRARRVAEEGQGSVLSTELLLLAGVLFCTVAGYFALQPMMVAARAGQGALSFGALHALSTVFYGLKTLLVLVLAWRLSRPRVS
jgi:Domain of unknown function (DUF4149)